VNAAGYPFGLRGKFTKQDGRAWPSRSYYNWRSAGCCGLIFVAALCGLRAWEFLVPLAMDRVVADMTEETNALSNTSVSTIKILSINLYCHHFVGARDMVGRARAAAAYVREQKYDIVMVQELFEMALGPYAARGAVVEFESQMLEAGLRHQTQTAPTRPWIFGQNNGVVIFSRFPVVSEVHRIFAASNEHLNNKGYVIATLQLDPSPQRLILVNCHLDSSNVAAKRAQMQQIATDPAMRPSLESGTPVIVGGDFNICQQPRWDDGALYRSLTEALLPLQDLFSSQEIVTFSDDNVAYDHLFVPEAIALCSQVVPLPLRPNGQAITDHSGVEAVLDFSLLQ